jgi:AcrR family transcriptional regulator
MGHILKPMGPDLVTGKRLGRPPATDSGDTRRRILDIARAAFATGGYNASTNRELAADAGITAGALYHYFGSKLDLYAAVHDDVQGRIYVMFNDAADRAEGFLGKFEAVLDTAHQMNRQDPTLAAFVGVVRADMRRHPEIHAKLGEHASRRDDFFVRLVDAGVEAGEITQENRKFMIEFVLTILTGLTDGVSDDVEQHKRAITSIKMILRGELLTRRTSGV